MNLAKAHKKVQEDRIKREIMRKVENRLIWDVTIGMKAVFLLALKKRRLGETACPSPF